MPELNAPFAEVDLPPLLEAYLFVATEPVQPVEIARILQVEAAAVEEALEDMVNAYARRINSGLNIVRIANGYQMATRPGLAADIGRLLAAPGQKSRLSKPALETLAIIAYQQPVTQAEIEAVRGVNADGVLKTLTERRLIEETGRKEVPGRPFLYSTTPDFLHYFGLNTLEDLPPLEDIVISEAEADKAATHEALEAVGLEEE
ncbi:MAG: SMC-Scp complex subunit ScpB [Armatimonadota bacterium]|nr:SMC-Scp complex subunit ScpB [Armatimonadota bacterium]